jgi:hypothetical protein
MSRMNVRYVLRSPSRVFARLCIATMLAGLSLCVSLLPAGEAHATPRASATASATQCSRTEQLTYVAANYGKGMVSFADANGAGRRQLFRAATPEISPNGRMVAVTRFGRSDALGIFTVCGGRVGAYFSAHDAITGITWSPDSSMVAAVVDPQRNGSVFGQRLVLIDIATGQVRTVATGFLSGWGGPSFSPTAPYRLAYDVVPRVNGDPDVWATSIGTPAEQLTHGGWNEFPLWGPQGILYEHVPSSGEGNELERFSGGHATKLMRLNGWPVALSSDGVHLAAEGAACGVVWPLSVNLVTRKVVHQFANGFAPFGISPSGGALLVSGSPPAGECGGKRSVIETVPFGGGKPTKIAYGSSPSWADSPAVSVQP